MMEKENILDGGLGRLHDGKDNEKDKKDSDIVFDRGLKCWSVCAVSFLLQFLAMGQVNSFGAAMMVSCSMPPLKKF